MLNETELVHNDWLGNLIREGCWVVYSSKSTNTGMNLGVVEYVGLHKIQVRVREQSQHGWSKGRLITLRKGEGAYNSVTRYFGTIPQTAQ